MRLPDLVAYQAAVQHPSTAFADAELRVGTVTAGRFGLPRAVAGNFAVTYQVCNNTRRWAVRCFHRDAADRAQRYAAISRTLERIRASALVPIAYLPLGVRVGQTWFPVTKMPWLDGVTLNRAVKQLLSQPDALRDLERRFVALLERLRHHGLAHGDLQHGNILVDAAGELRLVDYDGMFVPALKGLRASERGDPNYQHPRRGDEFDCELDRFSALVIVAALRALAAEPGLWSTYNSDDNLLFRRSDFTAPARSPLFGDLAAIPATIVLSERLAQACTEDFARVPLVSDILAPNASLVAVVPPLHVAILNRLYGSSSARARNPSSRRSWKLRRSTPQTALTFSPDSASVVTADQAGTIRIRRVVGGRTEQTLPLKVPCVALGFGSHVVALMATGRLVHVPQRPGKAAVEVWAPPRRVSPSAVAVSGNGAYVALGNTSGALRCWSVAHRKLIGAGRQRGSVIALAASSDGSCLASAGGSPGVHLWSLPSGRALRVLATNAPIVGLAFSGDNQLLGAATRDGTVLVWDLATSRVVHELRSAATGFAGLALSHAGDSVAWIGEDGCLTVQSLCSARKRDRLAPRAGWLSQLLRRWA